MKTFRHLGMSRANITVDPVVDEPVIAQERCNGRFGREGYAISLPISDLSLTKP